MRKKKKFLSTLAINALVGAMAIGTANTVYADTSIVINGYSSGSDDKWTSGIANSSGLHTYEYDGSYGDTYTYWTHNDGHSGDSLTMTGGELTINSLPNGHDWIKASGGDITVNSGPLNLNSNSYITSAVDLVVNSNGVINIDGGSVVLNSNNDSISGIINANSGTFTISGGSHNLGNSTIGSSVNFAVTGGSASFNSASNIGKSFSNAGTVTLNGGTLAYSITGTGSTVIGGSVKSNASIATSGGITINSGKQLEINADNVDANVTNNASNGLLLTGGTLNKNVSGTNGSVKISTTGTVTNNATISQGVNVNSGAFFNNANHSVTGTTSVNTGASATNEGSMATVANSGTFTNQGSGTISGTVTNSGTFNLKNSGVSDYAQSTGTLNITNGGSLTLTSATNTITGGTVNLGETTTPSIGKLVINNGLETNQAKIVTVGASELDIQKGSFTTNANSSIAEDAKVTIGSSENNGTLQLSNGGLTLDGTNDTWNTKGTVTVNGGALSLKGVTQNGTFTQTSGSTTIDAAQTLTSNTSITGGNLNITNGNLTVDGANAVIGSGATVNLAAGKTLNIKNTKTTTATDGITLDSSDTWAGAITQSGGALELKGRTDSTTDSKTYTQTAGTLTIDNGGSLTLNTDTGVSSSITGGTVQLGEGTGNTAGTLIVNNGIANLAKVITEGTSADSVFTVKGAGTQFSTKTGTNIAKGTVNVGDGTNSSVLKIENDSVIAKEVTLNVANGSSLYMKNSSQATINSGDTWAGQIYMHSSSTSTLTVLDSVEKTGYLTASAGTLNIGNGTDNGTLLFNNSNDVISSNVAATIYSGSKLAMSNGNAILDNNNDTWNGEITLSGGNLELSGRDDSTTATKTYNQSGGTLTLNNSDLTLATDASGITSGTVNINADSTLTVDNEKTNNAAIIKSDTNTSNALTVGGTKGATLTLNSGSDIDKDTAVTITANGALNATGTSIKGGSTEGITNDGIFNLTNDGTTAGTIARAIDNAAGDGTTGTVNLTGTTLSTAAGTIDQKYVNIGDGSGDAGSDKSVFTMGADVTVSDTLKVFRDGKIVNAENNIATKIINVVAGGSIVGDGTTEGDLIITNGGTNAGTISQDDVYLVEDTLHNTGSLTSNGIFLNMADSTVDNNGTEGDGTLNVSNGINSGSITQGNMKIASGNTVFFNNNTIYVETKLDNQGLFENNKDVTVQNSTNDAELVNASIIDSNNDSTIKADTLTNTNGIMNLTKSDVTIYYQADDIKGIVNVLGADDSVDKTNLTILGTNPNFAGILNVGDITDETVKSTLNLNSGNVLEEAILSVASGNGLNIDDSAAAGISSVVVDGASDTYLGDITLASGYVEMKDLGVKTGAISTTVGGELPYYEQTGGYLTLTNSVLSMKDSSLISGGDLTVDSRSTFNSLANGFSVDNLTNAGMINAINNEYENYAVSSGLYAGDGINDKMGDFKVDLYARSNWGRWYDSFGSKTTTIYATNGTDGILNIDDWALHGDLFGYDAPMDKYIFFPNLINGTVAPGHNIRFTSSYKSVATPIGNYSLFSLGGGNYALGLTSYNPTVYRGQVTTVAQYQNQLMIDDMIFNHTMLDQGFKGNDYLSSHPNYYASANDLYAPYQYSRKDGGLWLKMYGTFERLQMNQGLDVGNNAYGAIIGADFGLKELGHGWQFMPTAYIAYNGAHQYWDGVGAYQNGGQLGFLGTFYKNNFMLGAMAYGGVYGNVMSTSRGNDNTFNYFAGTAVKTAYNWRFAKDWSLQPNLMVAYNFFGQQNWHTNYGQMGMMAGMLNGINIAPGVNLIWEKETFSIYATLQYMYNINQSSGGRAGNVNLPYVHMDRGYIQYGLGINKRFTDRFSGYFQTVFRNVGRTGVSLQMGFQWAFGQKGNAIKKGSAPKAEKPKINLKGNKA